MAAAEQKSNVRGQEAEPAQKDVTAKAPLQPPGDAPVEAVARPKPTPNEVCSRKPVRGSMLRNSRSASIGCSRLELQLRALQAGGAKGRVIVSCVARRPSRRRRT